MTTTLQTRIDAKLKRDAKKTLEAMGLDLDRNQDVFDAGSADEFDSVRSAERG